MVGTQARTEGSITASLRELERLERERLHEEREARRRARETEEAARRAAEERVEAERVTRERRAEEAWLARTRLEREDAARAAGMERALVESAKAEAAARALAREREEEHRRGLERAAAADGRGLARLRRVAGALLAALALVVGGAGGGYGLVLAPRWASRVEAARDGVAARDETIARLRTKLTAAEGDAAAARRDLVLEASHTAVLETRVVALEREIDRRRRVKSAPGPSPVRAPETAFSTHCDPASGDPLCASIGR